MKIIILTHPLETNYGGILQNYALQTVLRQLGHEALTIDYHNDKALLYKIVSFIVRFLRHYLCGQKQIPIVFSIHKTGHKKLNENPEIFRFIRDYIRTTQYIGSTRQLKKVLKLTPDCIVVGSDQVWQKEFVPASFLDFAVDYDCRKVAYAASGNIDWMSKSKILSKLQQLISKFNYISVREENNIGKCKSILNVNATMVLDPVFLADKINYLKLTSNPEKYNHTLTTYILDQNSEKSQFINNIAAAESLKINNTTSGERISNIPSIESWLSALAFSRLIITDSFHGMVLSIVFNKEFFVIGNSKRGTDRFHTVLKYLGLMDRLLDENNIEVKNTSTINKIDYKKVNTLIDHARESSLDFLKMATASCR